MVILKEQGTSQNFKIIPRVNQADSLVIKGIEGSTSYYTYV